MATKPKLKVIDNGLIAPPAEGPFRLFLGRAVPKPEGMVVLARSVGETIDRVVDLAKPNWPIADGVVYQIATADQLLLLTGPERIVFMDECWRVLEIGSQMAIQLPGGSSNGACTNPFYQWPPIFEDSFYYFSREWREKTGCPYDIKSNFHWGYGFILDDELVPRNSEYQRVAAKTQRNSIHQLHVTLTKLE